MEPKKLKKLSLKKETIANLSNLEQTRIVGGGSDNFFCTILSWFVEDNCQSKQMAGCPEGGGYTNTCYMQGCGTGSCEGCGPSCQCVSADGWGPCISD